MSCAYVLQLRMRKWTIRLWIGIQLVFTSSLPYIVCLENIFAKLSYLVAADDKVLIWFFSFLQFIGNYQETSGVKTGWGAGERLALRLFTCFKEFWIDYNGLNSNSIQHCGNTDVIQIQFELIIYGNCGDAYPLHSGWYPTSLS